MILTGERQATLTIHEMAPDEVDSGDILVQREVAITESTTVADLLAVGRANAPAMFREALDGIEKTRSSDGPKT